MNKHLAAIFVLTATALPVALPAAVPLRWTVETNRVQPAQFEAYHGETIEFEATVNTYGKPLEAAFNPAFYWQTNGMGSAYWTAPATLSNHVLRATWSPTNDVGASVYSCFIGCPGEIYRAAFQLRLRPSPGAVPAELPLPVKTLDFAQVQVLNSPYFTRQETDDRIRELAVVPTDWATVSNRAMNAVQPTDIADMETRTHAEGTYQPRGEYLTPDAASALVSGAITGAVDHTSVRFSNEVLAVGLNIDTNSVAVLNEIASTFGSFPIEGTATSIGGLLLALAAAVAWLKKNKLGKADSIQQSQVTGLATALADKITNPSGGAVGNVLKKTANGVEWGEGGGGGELWDLELTKAENIPASVYRGAYSLKSVTSLSTSNAIGIGAMAFAYLPNLQSVSIGKGGTIAADAFYGSSLEELEILNGVASMSLFGASNLLRINMPNATTIGYEAFSPGAAGSLIEDLGDLSHITSIAGNALAKTKIVQVPDLPACTSIGADYGNSFSNCPDLVSVGDCPVLTTLGTTWNGGVSVFKNCTNLESVGDMPSLTALRKGEFSNCPKLASVGDLSSVTEIGSLCFQNAALETLSLPSCTTLPWQALINLRMMRNLTLGTITTASGDYQLGYIGSSRTADSDGIKAIVTVGNTMESLRALTGWPFGVPNQTKFVCSDGYITYENGAWTNHAN